MNDLPQGFQLDDLPKGFTLDDPGLPAGFKLDSGSPLLPAKNNPNEIPPLDVNQASVAKPPSLLETYIRAVQELMGMKSAAQSTVAGLVGFPAGLASGAVEGIYKGKSLAETDAAIGERVHKITDYLDKNNSKTPFADKYNSVIGQAINQVGIPLAGVHLGVPAPLRKKSPKATDFDAKLKGALDETPSATPPGIETIRQHELFDQPEQFRGANPYEAVTGDWRVDENGIPIKADLSMDVQNAQQPLQRNLWGDELAQKHPQENAMSLPEAIDSMPDLPWKTERDAGIDLLNKGGVGPEGRLDAAILEAETRKMGSENPSLAPSSVMPEFKVPRSQRGAIDTQAVKETIDGFKRGLKSAYDVLDSYKGAFHPDELAYMREKISTPKSRDGVVLLSPDEFHALAASRSQDYLSNKSRSYGPELKRMSVREGLKSDKGLSDIPWLLTKTTDGVAKVTGHEGRHRMDVFKEMGIEQVPVLIRDSNVRWGEGKNEYNPAPPTKIIGENSQIARAMPEVLNHKYDSNGIRVPRLQRGAIDLGPNLKTKQEAIEKIVKEKIFATPPKAEEVVAESTAHGKDSRGINSMEAGASLAAMKRRSPLILGVSRIVQHAKNVAEDGIRSFVFPTERKLRSLKSEEITNLSKIMIEEERAGKRLSATQLADLGLSEKQLIAYESIREMNKQALARTNAARAAQGKKPITEREAFVSSRWKGDFRRPFLDKEGRLKWYLAADSKKGLEVQTKALLEKFPELVQGKDHQTKSSRGFNEHPEEIYSLMVDVLGRDDPAVAKIHEWMQEQGVNEARGMLAQEKHFKNKSGVRGFVGDRPSNTLRGKLDQRKEALAFFQEQINYAKNAHKWSGMQEAAQELKKVFADKTLQDQQPNNMAYAKDYFRNQIGLSTHKAIAGLEDAVRETGISPHVLNNAIGNVKSLWITQKLVASAGFIASNVIQAANILPHLTDMAVKYRGNPLYAIPMGLSSGMLMAAGHMSIAAGKKGFYQTLSVLPKEEGAFLAKAMKYAEDNSVVARSIYDEAPIASSFSKTTKIAQIGGKTITAPETVLRSIAYMTYVNMLKSSGKFKNDLDIFRLAEERTNISMADYRQGERAMLFDKLGTVGNAMNTLQTFPINYYQQWNWAAREAGKGNVLPAAVMFVTQAYVAGAMGIPGFADTDKLWNWMKGMAAEHSPQLWDKMKDIDLKEIMLGMGNSALYGGLSEQSGISFTSRAAAPAGSEMLSSPLGPYQDFGRQLGDVGNAIVNPSAQSGAQALLSVAPTGMQGALEVGPLKDQTSVINQETGKRVYGRTRDLASREGQVARSPQDELIRATGLRSQREVVERDQAYRLNKLQSDSNTVIAKLPNKIYNELRNNNMEKATDLINLYSRLSGSQISSQQIENEAMKEFTTSSQRATMGATTVPALVALKRLQQIQEKQKGP